MTSNENRIKAKELLFWAAKIAGAIRNKEVYSFVVSNSDLFIIDIEVANLKKELDVNFGLSVLVEYAHTDNKEINVWISPEFYRNIHAETNHELFSKIKSAQEKGFLLTGGVTKHGRENTRDPYMSVCMVHRSYI